MATAATRRRRPGAGTSVSIGLFVSLIVLVAVVLTLAIRNDDPDTVQNSVPAAPLSYYAEGAGEGIVGGHDEGIAPALRAYTGEFQGENLLNTADDLSANRPIAPYNPFSGEGLVGGNLDAGDVLTPIEQARIDRDEWLFKGWNDTPGWLAQTEPTAVMTTEEMRFLEMNGVYDTRGLAAAPTLPTVDLFAQIRFLEMNTYLPGWSENTERVSDRQRFTKN